MDSRHDMTIGHELQAAETSQIPVVPDTTADAADQGPTWRRNLAVSLALLVAFVVVTLVGL